MLMEGGRVVNVSSGAGSMNMDKMSHGKRSMLMRTNLTVQELYEWRDEFLAVFARTHATDEASLPALSGEMGVSALESVYLPSFLPACLPVSVSVCLFFFFRSFWFYGSPVFM